MVDNYNNTTDVLFKKATEDVFKATKVSNEDKLILYGLYKQSVFGNCTTKKPMLNFKEKMKWESWMGYEGIHQHVSKRMYIDKVRDILYK